MVKILGICGSPRKMATYYALEQALEGMRLLGFYGRYAFRPHDAGKYPPAH